MKVVSFTVTNNGDNAIDGWLTENDITSRISIPANDSLELVFPDNENIQFESGNGIEREITTEMEEAEGKLD